MQYQNHLSLRLGAIWYGENRQIVAATVDLMGYDSQLPSPDPQTIDRGSRFQSKSENPGFPVQSAASETRTALLSQSGSQKGAINICIAGGVGV